jgi:hypothetical protein
VCCVIASPDHAVNRIQSQNGHYSSRRQRNAAAININLKRKFLNVMGPLWSEASGGPLPHKAPAYVIQTVKERAPVGFAHVHTMIAGDGEDVARLYQISREHHELKAPLY